MPVHYLSDPAPYRKSAELYMRVRELEGRVHPDDLVRRLPDVPKTHPHFGEWRMRAASTARFIRFLKGFGDSRILDLGCGNGWTAHRIAEALPGTSVTGLDMNVTELEQAARLFPRPRFCYGDIFADDLSETFDIIYLACSVQYFPDPAPLFQRLAELLTPEGQVHIIDSPFYEPGELEAARERSRAYYRQLGVPEMARNYFHHDRRVMLSFKPDLLYRPQSPINRLRVRLLRRNDTPFPWLRFHARNLK
ncbi:MAG: methyltransferase domain-containing protein [Acidobacteriota bacterium]|nr:methyltransferase domain-containing protein [Acidobacteriota bacterium]